MAEFRTKAPPRYRLIPPRGLGLNIGHFQELSSRRSSFRAERYVPRVSIKQPDSVASGYFLTGTCSVDPESRWPNLEPRPRLVIASLSPHTASLSPHSYLKIDQFLRYFLIQTDPDRIEAVRFRLITSSLPAHLRLIYGSMSRYRVERPEPSFSRTPPVTSSAMWRLAVALGIPSLCTQILVVIVPDSLTSAKIASCGLC